MRYLITTETDNPFLTKWFDAENHFNPNLGMVVFDLFLNMYTIDGEKWYEIQIDHF